MMCPVCGKDTAVKDSRPSDLNTIRRRRVCESGHKTTTWESTRDPAVDLRAREAKNRRERARKARMAPEERQRREKVKWLRKVARKEAAATCQPVEVIYQRWEIAA